MAVTLKLATSLDGRIATATGESRWITGPESRAETHRMRGRHQAVLVGIGTALADDPELNVRLPGYDGPQPTRVVLDGAQRLSPLSRLATTARDIPTLVLSLQPADPALIATGVQVVTLNNREPVDVLAALETQGLRDIFIEGGGQVAASFLRADLVDELVWFRAPILIGAEGRAAIADLGLDRLADVLAFRRVEVREMGRDLMERYVRT